jgi:hypothetical protein
MNANEGVQSFNIEVGQNFKSFKEFESQLKHYLMSKNKISKTKETAEWNCSFCKTYVHLYASIAMDV